MKLSDTACVMRAAITFEGDPLDEGFDYRVEQLILQQPHGGRFVVQIGESGDLKITAER